MKLITLLCVCLSITAGTWAYSPKCAQGPKYWCRDAATARECGAVQRCEQTVWRAKESAKKPSTTGETAHMLCNVLVEASSELLAAGSIHVDSIKEYIRQDCTKLPNQANLVQQCEMAVDIYLADILLHLTSGTESSKICSIIQGHDTASMPIVKPKPSGVSSNQTCVLCEFVVQILATVASANASAQELAHILENICHEMPAVLRDECSSFVTKYGVDIIALLVRGFDPAKVCTLIKLCTKSQNVDFLIRPNAKMCGLCDYVSTSLSAGLPKENVCKNFATENNLKEQCEVLVHLYKPNLCAVLPLCSDEIQPLDSSVQSAECSLCKYVVNYIDAVIQTNKSEAAIEAALEKVCSILPGPIQGPCKTFVDTYGPLLVQLIQKYGTADKVCDALKLCNNGTQVAEPLSQTITKSVRRLKDGGECTLCKYILNYVNLLIKSNVTAEELKKALDVVCSILPSADHDKCKTFVTNYAPILAELIAELDDPNTVCQWLGLCSKSDKSFIEIPAVKRSKVQSLQCNLCEYVVHYLDAIVQSNSTETKFEDALDKACKVLPEKKLEMECRVLVRLYGGDLIKFLVQYGDPKAVCEALKICDK